MTPTPESFTRRPDAETARVIIDGIEWQRIRMRLSGHFVDGLARDAVGSAPEFFVECTTTGQRVNLPGVSGGLRFAIDCNAMRLDGLDPLQPGIWTLFARAGHAEGNSSGDGDAGGRVGTRADAEPIPVGVTGDMTAPEEGYGGAFVTGAYSYRVLPSASAETGGFALVVEYQQSPKKPRPPGLAGLTRDARALMRALRKSVFSATYAVSRRLVRKNGRKILLTSDSRSELSGNLGLIHSRMLDRGLDREYTLMTTFKSSIVSRRSFLEKFKLPYLLAIADVIILDDFHPLLYQVPFGPEVRIIQVWHASGAFKTVGYSRVGKAGGPSPFAKSHKNYTHAIVSSQHDVPFYAEAFGLPEARVVATGIPRMDLFFDDEYKTHAVESVYAAMPRLRDSRVIL